MTMYMETTEYCLAIVGSRVRGKGQFEISHYFGVGQ